MAESAQHENAWQDQAEDILQHYAIGATGLERITDGLINLSLKVRTVDGQRYILQRLHPVFDRTVNQNIELVTTHLTRKGMLTPRLVRTITDRLDVERDEQIWRLLTFVDGASVDRLDGLPAAREAGGLLARFHRALLDFDGELKINRPPVHGIERHLERLNVVLEEHAQHVLHGDACHLTEQVHTLLKRSSRSVVGTSRLVHGDPKVANIMFDPTSGGALCMIDLDTLTYMPLALELGDAFRSWCNPSGEDHPEADFDIDLFEAAFNAYVDSAHEVLNPKEATAIVPATLEIYLELTVRFLADALEETYFAWEPARYANRGEHNLARARGQLSAARSLVSQFRPAERLVSRKMS